MNKTAQVVVGLGYGDEGKGRTVDYLCSQNHNSIVIRFSGGSQAGHHVKIKNYKEHTFSSYGSGTLRGIRTYLSHHVAIRPANVINERDALYKKGVVPNLIVNPLTMIVTEFDFEANRICDKDLSNGTCGQGIGKTMHRNLTTPFKLYAIDTKNEFVLRNKLKSIATYYGYNPDCDKSKELIQKTIDDLEELNLYMLPYNSLKDYGINNYIFEGSQGVLLDMEHGMFPHVTYSNTTSKNALEICKILGIEDISIYGVTRTYHTRHGNGPFVENEDLIKKSYHPEENNKFNKFQGEFKIAKLDVNLLYHAISIEKTYSNGYNFTLVVTCADQYPIEFHDMIAMVTDNSMLFVSPYND